MRARRVPIPTLRGSLASRFLISAPPRTAIASAVTLEVFGQGNHESVAGSKGTQFSSADFTYKDPLLCFETSNKSIP